MDPEIKNTGQFKIAQKMKYLGVNLAKCVRDLYVKNYTILMKETKKHLNKKRNMPCSWIGRLNSKDSNSPPN